MFNRANIPYWRLSSFYFFYFTFLGAWVPFWNLYLERELAFSAQQIGSMTAIMMCSRILGPYLWGWLADFFDRRISVIRWGAFAAGLSFLLVFIDQQYAWLMCAVFLYSFFWNAILSQFEVVTLSHLGADSLLYSRIRLWGSVGFIIAVLGLGLVFDYFSLAVLPEILLLLLVAIWLASLTVAEKSRAQGLSAQQLTVGFSAFKKQLLRKPVVVFMLISFLMQFSHGPYYTFFSIYLEQLSYSRSMIGGLWALGVVAEVLLFIVIHHLMRRFSLRLLLMITLILSAIRWFILGLWADTLVLLLFSQILHAASFASFHAISMEFLHRSFDGRSHGQGQATYSAFSYGVGGALGALVSGWLWTKGASYLFVIAGVAVCLAISLMFFYRDK
ncbi:MAG: MFS transporter, partial [Pseudomonadales bacterium]|nr:MFS transporter [Pseudomonadales bacterium]